MSRIIQLKLTTKCQSIYCRSISWNSDDTLSTLIVFKQAAA